MPVHFNSFLNYDIEGEKDLSKKIFSGILSNDLENPDDVFVNKSKDRLTLTKYIINLNNNKKVGKTVITIKIDKKNEINELVDIDLTLLNNKPITLLFEEKLDPSSEANEYYLVNTEDEIYFQIETVNRCTIESKNIENTKQSVYLSAFPIKFDIYNNVNEFNEEIGFKPTKVKGTDTEVSGFADNFTGVGSIFLENPTDDDTSSLIIGKVHSFEDINTIIGGEKCSFTIIKLKTAFGILPTIVSKSTFDLSNLSKDKTVVMLVDIKADFLK